MAIRVSRLTDNAGGAKRDHSTAGTVADGPGMRWIVGKPGRVVEMLAFFAIMCCFLATGGVEVEGSTECVPVVSPQGPQEGPAGVQIPAAVRWPLSGPGACCLIPFVPCLGFVVNRRERRPGHPARAIVCRAIRENPGASLVELAHLTGMNRGTLKYHLLALGVEGEIVTIAQNGRLHFFPNNGMYNGQEKIILYHLRNPASRQILLLLHQRPGMCRKEIADQIGVSGPTVSWHMQRLHGDGVIEDRREGRNVRYYLAPCVIPLIQDCTADLSCT